MQVNIINLLTHKFYNLIFNLMFAYWGVTLQFRHCLLQ